MREGSYNRRGGQAETCRHERQDRDGTPRRCTDGIKSGFHELEGRTPAEACPAMSVEARTK